MIFAYVIVIRAANIMPKAYHTFLHISPLARMQNAYHSPSANIIAAHSAAQKGGGVLRFSDEFLSELRSRVDIEELIGRYTEIRHRGSRTPVALCPFHTEKTPSFVVYRETQSYYCFGCGAGGDAITFIRNIEHLDYPEAVRYLCERVGMSMPTDPVDDEYNRLRRRCFEANREAARFFYARLMSEEGKAARDYLKKRQLTDETVKHFGLGYAPDRWDSLVKYLRGKGYRESELISFDLARKTSRGGTIDAFRNRLMFPIIDLRGNVIAFGGRVLDDSKPKYLNTSDTAVFKKSHGVYALNFAKNNSKGKLILCEGYMDVIAMHQAGFTNAVACLGTAFTNEQISLLSRYCNELTLCFDSDEAGVKATNRALKLLENAPMKLRVMQLSGGKDADEIIKTEGKARMSNFIETALNDTEFALQSAEKKYDVSTDDGKLNYMNEAVEILAALDNEIERDLYSTRLANEIGVEKQSLAAQIAKARKARGRREKRQVFENAMDLVRAEGEVKSPNPQKRQFRRACAAEEIILASLLKHPDYLNKLRDKLSEDVFVTDFNRRFFRDIAARIRDGRSLDLSVFNETAENEDIAYLSYLLAKGETLADSPAECEQCIQTLLQEKNKAAAPEIGKLSDDEFRALFDKKRIENASK